MDTPLLAFLDLETTGFSPKRGDKILEVAIVTTDLEGNVVDKYETLINPRREITGVEIHQITAEMVKHAPIISEVLDDLLHHLQGKVIVGHNVSFDLRFLNFELSRQTKMQVESMGICTMSMSRKILPELPVRRLDAFCSFFDIKLDDAHSAIADCEATLQLYFELKQLSLELGIVEFDPKNFSPFLIDRQLLPKGISVIRSQANEMGHLERTRLADFIHRLPSNPADHIPVQLYLNLLDEVLADRVITASEAQLVMDLITEFGVSKEQVLVIHADYLKKLVRVYLLDGILSDSEQSDLAIVAQLLNVSSQGLQSLILEEQNDFESNVSTNSTVELVDVMEKSICFTGQLNARIKGILVDRSKAQQFALERGMIIKSGINSKLDYLVTADPNSLSGKSLKAREIGVRVIAEPVFWAMLGVRID
ncbi:exonuclease domain-containing protein [Algoriphagus aquimarinus]|uniref:exonuclease domain-containing protein n=1 Tax=Algoriphagus aquimarinus TaxID=237018 RepID=UPI0030D72DC5|tara:strand:- start:945 stop:2213 length:1269 start_codon:yes stop_codon:yes gene_type:complete